MAPIHDSKEALRFRAVCDERTSTWSTPKLVAGLSKSSMVEVKVNWRCNVVHDEQLYRLYEQAAREPYSFLFVCYLKPKKEMFYR